MTRRDVVSNARWLTDAIALGCAPGDRGPIAVEIPLWDGRIVFGSYYDRETPDVYPVVETRENIIWDDDELHPHVVRLLESGAAFVTDTGEDDTVCTLKWEIRES